MIVRFEDYSGDGLDRQVEMTQQEFDKLVAPALARNLPIDGGTISTELFDDYYRRDQVAGIPDEMIPMV